MPRWHRAGTSEKPSGQQHTANTVMWTQKHWLAPTGPPPQQLPQHQGSRAAGAVETYHLLAVLGEGGLDEHGPQGKAQVVVCVADAELPAWEAGLHGARGGCQRWHGTASTLPASHHITLPRDQACTMLCTTDVSPRPALHLVLDAT